MPPLDLPLLNIKNRLFLFQTGPLSYIDDGNEGRLREPDYYAPLAESSAMVSSESHLDVLHDFISKNVICSHIFGSVFFDANGEDVVDLIEQEIRDTLLQHNLLTVYEDIYDDYPFNGGKFLNQYTCRKVLVGENTFEEAVFRCLCRKRDESKNLIEYFLSSIYDVNESTHSEATLIRARFVFTYNSSNILRVVAIAEEPAIADPTVINETNTAYFERRNYQHPGKGGLESLLKKNHVISAT